MRAKRASPRRSERPERRRLHVAVVSSTDGVLLTAVEGSAEALLQRLAAHVEANAAIKLWPDDAGRVGALIAADRLERAVDLYFSRVGERWDPEHLHTQVVEVG